MLREFIPEPAYSTTDEDTVFALLSRRAERDPEDLIAQWQDDETRRWHDVTAGEMLERVRAVAKGLLGLGVKTGNMVVIYSPTCYEWGVVDFACAAIGAVSVPVYETDSAKQAECKPTRLCHKGKRIGQLRFRRRIRGCCLLLQSLLASA